MLLIGCVKPTFPEIKGFSFHNNLFLTGNIILGPFKSIVINSRHLSIHDTNCNIKIDLWVIQRR